jgi:hypothetical protein
MPISFLDFLIILIISGFNGFRRNFISKDSFKYAQKMTRFMTTMLISYSETTDEKEEGKIGPDGRLFSGSRGFL